MKELLFATSNKDKVAEAQAILGLPIEIVDIEVDEIQSMDLEYVAKKKVEEVFKIVNKPVFVDDVAVFINAWKGYPGPLIKYLQQIPGNEKILQFMKEEEDRSCSVQSAIGYHDGKNVHVFIGEVMGVIAKEERGSDGWGFDPLFIPDGQTLTYAEMGIEGKSKLSHRQRALHKFKAYLDSQKA